MRECELTYEGPSGEEHSLTVAHPEWDCGKLTDEAMALAPKGAIIIRVWCGESS